MTDRRCENALYAIGVQLWRSVFDHQVLVGTDKILVRSARIIRDAFEWEITLEFRGLSPLFFFKIVRYIADYEIFLAYEI